MYITVNQDKFKKLKELLGLFKEIEGLNRCKGCLGMANTLCNTNRPVTLLTDHRVTELIIAEVHKEMFHRGLAEALSLK